MSTNYEPVFAPYYEEIQQFTAAVDENIVSQILSAGVRWSYAPGVEPDAFIERIHVGVGYYTLIGAVNDGYNQLPRPRCNDLSPETELSKLRLETEIKQGRLIAGLREILANMDDEAPIAEEVTGLTGAPPKWSNVLRLTSAGKV